MPVDALVTLRARASAGMVLTRLGRNIPSSASEELISEDHILLLLIHDNLNGSL